MSATNIYHKYGNLNEFLDSYEECKGREEYLKWVDQWKAKWHELVADIREVKAMRKETGGCYDENADWIRQALRSRAHDMIVTRHAAKAWSVAQKKAALEDAA